jgi:hypothetical protein
MDELSYKADILAREFRSASKLNKTLDAIAIAQFKADGQQGRNDSEMFAQHHIYAFENHLNPCGGNSQMVQHGRTVHGPFIDSQVPTVRETYALYSNLSKGPPNTNPEFAEELLQWISENSESWKTLIKLADEAGELFTDFLYAGVRADWMTNESVNCDKFHTAWIMSLFDYRWSKTSGKQANCCERHFWQNEIFMPHDEEHYLEMLSGKKEGWVSFPDEIEAQYLEWSIKCPDHFISELKDPFISSARLLESLPFLERTPMDGPVAPGGFRWAAIVYSGLENVPWKLLNYAWNSKDRCGGFDEIAEKVWGDREYDFSGNPLKIAARKVRSHFKENNLPLNIIASETGRFVKIQRVSEEDTR